MTPVVHFLLNPLSKTPAQGAATTVWAAVADVPSGSYCGDCAVAKAGGKGNDAALAHALFAATEETIHTALAARAKADNASTIPAAVGAPGVEVVVRDSSSKE